MSKWLHYSPAFHLEKGQLAKHVIRPGSYVFLNDRWQKVVDMIEDGHGTLVTEFGDTLRLDRSPPDNFRYKEPNPINRDLAAIALAIFGAVTGVINVVVAILRFRSH